MLGLLTNFAQYSSYDYNSSYSLDPATSAGLGALFLAYLLFICVISVLTIIGMWKIFVKAGKPGWAAIIPIYNYIVLLQIVGRPVWWVAFFLLAIIPFVGWIAVLVLSIIVANDLAKSFGKDVGFTVLLVLLPFIGYLILGFGKDKYHGPSALGGGHHPHAGGAAPTPPPAAS